jgi:hypothetical protein
MHTLAAIVWVALLQDPDPEALVRKLGDRDFEEQGKAAKALEQIGDKARPALRKALRSDDPAVRTWAEWILQRLPVPATGPEFAPGRARSFLWRLTGKRDLVARGGGGSDTEDALLAALRWLARHQSEDGSWKVQRFTDSCKAGGKCEPNPGHEDFDTGVTGLALLAFLGAGYNHHSRDAYDGVVFGNVVRRGLQCLLGRQDPEGCVGSRSAQKYMYNHAIGATAIIEAYGLTKEDFLMEPAQKSVDFLMAAQNPGKGWRYSFKPGDNDTSVTSWCLMAHKSAEIAGLSFHRFSYDGARAWLDEVTDVAFYRTGYTHKGTGKVYMPGQNEHYDHHETLTAVAMLGRIFMDKDRADKRHAAGRDLLLKDLPEWKDVRLDFYYWYYGTLALYQYDGPSGASWKRWNDAVKDALVKNQNPLSKGCRAGSWDPLDRWSCEGGRIYATAINALTLETYYRYARVFGTK